MHTNDIPTNDPEEQEKAEYLESQGFSFDDDGVWRREDNRYSGTRVTYPSKVLAVPSDKSDVTPTLNQVPLYTYYDYSSDHPRVVEVFAPSDGSEIKVTLSGSAIARGCNS